MVPPLAKKLVAPIITLLCTGAIASLQFSKLAQVTQQANQTQSRAEYLQASTQEKASLAFMKKLPALGFDNLVADWAFLRFLQYFGDGKARQQTNYLLSPEYFEIIVDRDPLFLKPYLFLSTSTSLYAGKAQRTVALMNQGLKVLSPQINPDAYFVWLYKATDELLFLGNTQAAKNSYEQAIQWAKANGNPESQRIAALTARTVQFLARNPDSKQAQVNAWLMVLSNAVDDKTHQDAINKIKSLGGQITFTPDGTIRVQMPKQD
jgi:tetratricopeptide (TPR) repeat protein